jgi:hypothetical protein
MHGSSGYFVKKKKKTINHILNQPLDLFSYIWVIPYSMVKFEKKLSELYKICIEVVYVRIMSL